MSATQVFYQETTIETVLDSFAKGYNPPKGCTVLRAESNYDPRTGKVWFKLFIEMPEPEKKNIIVMN